MTEEDRTEEALPEILRAQAASGADPYAKYMLRAEREIQFVLRSMIDRRSQITTFFNEAKDLLLTALLAVGDDHLILDYGPSKETNDRALAAKKLFCTASLDKVKIQFLLKGVTQVEYKGRPAFRAALPDSLLRLQRREYYRLTTPVLRPLICSFSFASGDEAPGTFEARVTDISGGGVALTPPDNLDLVEGMTLQDCRIDLPEVGTALAKLLVRSVFEITLRGGGRIKRAGCEFIDLPGSTQNLVQRYIIKVERERKAKESGME